MDGRALVVAAEYLRRRVLVPEGEVWLGLRPAAGPWFDALADGGPSAGAALPLIDALTPPSVGVRVPGWSAAPSRVALAREPGAIARTGCGRGHRRTHPLSGGHADHRLTRRVAAAQSAPPR
ncbi:MAG: hypothetical protein U0531_14850 [Dehalococcoidia bacterium]